MKNWTYCDGDGGLDRAAPDLTTRRQALIAASALALGSIWWASPKSALAKTVVRKDKTNRNVLVSVFLRGGADGLNLVAPYGEDEYYKLRPSLALKSPKSGGSETSRLSDLDGFFGLSPALLPLLGAFKDGRMGIIHAVGSRDTTHSHFEAMATMERGLKTGGDEGSGGWLARHLNATGDSESPLRAVALSSIMPDSLAGATQALAIESITQYKLEMEEAQRDTLRKLYSRGDDPVSRAGRETMEVVDRLRKVDPAKYAPDAGASYPDTPMGRAFKETAFLIKQDIGLEIACLDGTGWDTHVTQGTVDGWLFGLVRDLAESMAAFEKDMGGEMSRVTVCVQTEFGRRVYENSGLGTDHGSGSVMLLLGGGVKGGKVYADWPGLIHDKLTGPGDLQITTDYRNILGELLIKRLETPSLSDVFPSLRYRELGVFGPKST